MYRDDRVSHELPESQIPVDVAGRTLVLVDDVLYTGRTIRSALDAVTDLGRPGAIRLCVLVDRGLRELPIQADYVGRFTPTTPQQRVTVVLSKEASPDDEITDHRKRRCGYAVASSISTTSPPKSSRASSNARRNSNARRPGRTLAGHACVNMFFEESTRTFTSFNMAELRLGADVVNLAPRNLSLASKGETLEDTAITLSAMGISVLVVRHPQAGFPAAHRAEFRRSRDQCGRRRRTRIRRKHCSTSTRSSKSSGDVRGRSIAIVGDILHSRVAHSAIRGLQRLGASVVLVGPECFLPEHVCR